MFKRFFKALGKDIATYFKKHYLSFIGYLSIYLVPIILITYESAVFKVEGWYLSVWSYPILVFILFIYYGRLRRNIATKLQVEKLADRIGASQNAFRRIGFELLDKGMLIVSLTIAYFIAKTIENMGSKFSNYLIVIIACVIVGTTFIVLDTIKNIAKDFEEKEEKVK